jgi:hypothetical protein
MNPTLAPIPANSAANPNGIPEFIQGAEGVFFDMPDPLYRKAPGVSNSMLKYITPEGGEPGSPAHFLQALHDPQADTEALLFGRMVHARILTPDEPLPGIVEIPETYPAPADCSAVKQKKALPGDPLPWHGAAKYCKAWLAEQLEKGLRPMTADAIKATNGVVKSVAEEPTCRVIFSDGKAEVSCFKRFFRGDGAPVLRKCRIDWVPTKDPALCDIKTCQDARACDFESVVFRRRYFVQAAYYLDLWNELNPDDQKTHFVFIAVEKFPPFAVQVFDLSDKAIEDGRWEYQHNLATLIECLKQGAWPSYPGGVHALKMRVPFGKGKTIVPE